MLSLVGSTLTYISVNLLLGRDLRMTGLLAQEVPCVVVLRQWWLLRYRRKGRR